MVSNDGLLKGSDRLRTCRTYYSGLLQHPGGCKRTDRRSHVSKGPRTRNPVSALIIEAAPSPFGAVGEDSRNNQDRPYGRTSLDGIQPGAWDRQASCVARVDTVRGNPTPDASFVVLGMITAEIWLHNVFASVHSSGNTPPLNLNSQTTCRQHEVR